LAQAIWAQALAIVQHFAAPASRSLGAMAAIVAMPEAVGTPDSTAVLTSRPVAQTDHCGSLVVRPANSAPLGALQPAARCCNHAGGVGVPAAAARCAAAEAACGRGGRRLPPLPHTGLDAMPVRRWLLGEVSGPLCALRALDGVARSQHTAAQAPHSLAALCISRSAAAGTELLGLMVGGCAGDVLFGSCGAGQTFGDDDVLPDNAAGLAETLEQAASHFPRSAEAGPPREATARGSEVTCRRLDEQDAQLAFMRLRLQTHPQRDSGTLRQYFSTHLGVEVLRQHQELRGEASTMHSTKHDELSDLDLLRLLAAEGCDECDDDVPAIEKHTRRLFQQRAMLEASLSLMRRDDAYRVLGLSGDASAADLARAYRSLARQMHPDRRGTAEAFQALRSAYEMARDHAGLRDGVSAAATETTEIEYDIEAAVSTVVVSQRVSPVLAADPAQESVASLDAVAAEVELALDMTLMCSGLARLAAGAGGRRTCERRGTVHATDAAARVGRAVGVAGRLTAEMPRKACALLEAVAEQCEGLRGSSAEPLHQMGALMQLLDQVASKGLRAVSSSKELLAHVDEMVLEAATPTPLTDLALRAGAAAADAASAALAVADAQLCVRRLTEALEATVRIGAGCSMVQAQAMHRADVEDGASCDAAQARPCDCGDGDGGSRDAEAGSTLGKEFGGRSRLLRELSHEVAALQKELRAFVSAHPEVLDYVSLAAKEALFSVLGEILRELAVEASRAAAAKGAEDPHDAIEAVLAPAFAAAAWDTAACPSLEARVLRLAGIVDAASLRSMLGTELFAPCLKLVRGSPRDDALQVRCATALAGIWPLRMCSEDHKSEV